MHRTFEFDVNEGELVRAALPLPPVPADAVAAGALVVPAAFVRVPDGRVVASVSESVEAAGGAVVAARAARALHFRVRTGAFPDATTFLVLLYDDAYYARLAEVWQVTLRSRIRCSLRALVGQATRGELLLAEAGTSLARRCRLTTSHPRELAFASDAPTFALLPGTTNRLQFTFTPAAPGDRKVVVQLVDVATGALVASWLLRTSNALPAVSRTYTVPLPVGGRADKKIPYVNAWDAPRRFRVVSTNPGLVTVKEPLLALPAHGRDAIRIGIGPAPAFGREDVLLFINDGDDGQNEETLLLQVVIT